MSLWPQERRRLAAALPAMKLRSDTLRTIRAFFLEEGFTEVETPVRIPRIIPETHIDPLSSEDHTLRASPELHMKKLLAAGMERIFQIGPCFRRGEFGALHNPEYTMLEWYRTGAGYRDVLYDAECLVTRVAACAPRPKSAPELAPPWHRLTVSEAFERHAGWDPVSQFDPDRFDTDLVGKVEPALPRDRPVVLFDYPAGAAALAKLKPKDRRIAERWELYVAGVELANAFSELTDATEQRERFKECLRLRAARGAVTPPVDTAFTDALKEMPPAAGVALGIDRLVMLLGGENSLDCTLPFREPSRYGR